MMDDKLPPLVENFFESGKLPPKLMIEHQASMIDSLKEQILSQNRTIADLRKWRVDLESNEILRKLDLLLERK